MRKNQTDNQFLDLSDPDDQVFIDAAAGMREAMDKSKWRSIQRRFVAEIAYKGKRHEVWLSVRQIRHRTWKRSDEKTNRIIGGYIKAKCLGLK